MILFISIYFFPPRLFWDSGHGPILDDKLQIVAIMNRKNNESSGAIKGVQLSGRVFY